MDEGIRIEECLPPEPEPDDDEEIYGTVDNCLSCPYLSDCRAWGALDCPDHVLNCGRLHDGQRDNQTDL